MGELKIIVTEVDDPDALAEAIAGDGDEDCAALAVERVLRGIPGGQFWGVEVMEVEIDGVRRWL